MTLSSNKNKEIISLVDGALFNYGKTNISFSPNLTGSNTITFKPSEKTSFSFLLWSQRIAYAYIRKLFPFVFFCLFLNGVFSLASPFTLYRIVPICGKALAFVFATHCIFGVYQLSDNMATSPVVNRLEGRVHLTRPYCISTITLSSAYMNSFSAFCLRTPF